MDSQEQFLEVVGRDEARRRFERAIRLDPLATETVELNAALGRVLAEDVISQVDVPSFDRSNLDGFALRAVDTYGAREERPRKLELLPEVLATGVVPQTQLAAGSAVSIATGGMLPRGADAIVPVENAEISGGRVSIVRPVTPGGGVTFAGTDISRGETALRRGMLLTSRETGVLAAIGVASVRVWRRPRVAIISTGDELIAPGQSMSPAMVYDSNARILADAVRELGAQPVEMGIAPDDVGELRTALGKALGVGDIVLLSGGTSKGSGDLSYRVVAELGSPGIVVHGVALKPGKPICLAAHGDKPIVILPGFPTSAVFTFHEFVAPVIQALAGRVADESASVEATLAVKINSEIGRTEFVLVSIVPEVETGVLVAYPMGTGSGSVTTFSRADGFIVVDRHREIVESGTRVNVQLIARDVRPADLIVIGSHCIGLDYLLGLLADRGYRTKFLAVGSTAGLAAAGRGQCDLAGIHLLDVDTGRYNRDFITPELELLDGYRRLQGVVYRAGDLRFAGKTAPEAIAAVKDDPDCLMVNRNQGSGTRILIDRLLDGAQPAGYSIQARNHHAVVAAVVQGRADWGVAIEPVVRDDRLGFLPIGDEHYDFVVPKSRLERPAVRVFQQLLADPQVRRHLATLGMRAT